MDKIYKFIDNKIADQFDYGGIKEMERISEIPGVIAPVVALPDFHSKKDVEAPSSIAVGIRKKIIPHLSSNSINCGMGAVATNLIADKNFMEKIGAFYNTFREQRRKTNYDLSNQVFFDVIYQGPRSLQERYDISDAMIAAFESRGSLVNQNMHGKEEVAGYVPDDVLNHPIYNGRKDLGTGFGGNHFLEIQKISRIYDEKLCRLHNIVEPGQIVMMYHGGGGIISGFMGGYYARRLKGMMNDFKLAYNKFIYHLKRTGNPASIPDIYKYYLGPKKYLYHDEDSKQGKRVALAYNIGMNYGYAYRLFMIIRIREALRSVFGPDNGKISLVKDIAHNSIRKEIINGKDLWVHRQNSVRVLNNSLTVLPGFNTTSSYICVGMENTASTLNSVPHGAGASIKAYIKKGLSQKIKDRTTMIFRNENRTPEIVQHYSDEGVDAIIRTLEDKRLLRPIAKVTPIAVLKDYK